MISIIIPTLGERPDELRRLFDSLHSQVYQNFEVILVTQLNHECYKSLSHYPFKIKHVKLLRKGLSYSRNEGLKHIEGTIVTFSDDDCWYPNDALQKAVKTFEQKASLDVACFQIFDPIQQVPYKSYQSEAKEQISNKDVLNKSSIEIFIKLANIRSQDLSFDENFGLGTKYPSGEENIFLRDLLKKNLKISYIPDTIVFHQKPELQTRLTEAQLISKGPLFKRLTNTPIAVILLILFFLKKSRHIKNPATMLKNSLLELLKYKN